MSGNNGRVYEMHSTSGTPFCIKDSDGVVIHDFKDPGVLRKIERDDTQIIVTVNPDRGNSEHKFFFPFGSLGLEIVFGRGSFAHDAKNGRF